MDARTAADETIVQLSEQDRSRWDRARSVRTTLELVTQPTERRFLERRLDELASI